MFALVLLISFVACGLGFSRFRSVAKREVHPSAYKLMAGDTPPQYVQKLNRNFSNLCETPVLFFTVCILYLVLELNSQFFINLAWVYVILRIIHTLIHVTYNYPLHRFSVFLLSSVALLTMWFNLIFSLS